MARLFLQQGPNQEEAMKRTLIAVGMLIALATSVGRAQTRVGISLSFGDPYFGGPVVISRPYYDPYYYRYPRPYSYYRYHPFYNEPPPRVIIVRPYRYHWRRRYHRW